MLDYVRHWFVDADTFVRRSGGDPDAVSALLQAEAAPGVIYAPQADGGWWSALAAYAQQSPRRAELIAEAWYAPAAVWWMRRGVLHMRRGLTADQAANENKRTFFRGFVAELGREPLASANFADCFEGGRVVPAAAEQRGASEWAGWTSGAYGVCLKVFTPESCVQKESLGRRVRMHFEGDGAADRLADDELLDLCERLDGWLLPFSPMERPTGTPGRTIDRTLESLDLGRQEPF